MPITQTAYPNLYGPTANFAVLASAGIKPASGKTLTIATGVYGSAPTADYLPGTITGTLATGTQITNGQAELGNDTSALGTLVPDVKATASAFGSRQSIPSPVLGVITILPETNYGVTGATALAFNNVTLRFDAGLNPNAQFFITSDQNITFTNTNMSLANSAQAINIFILARTASITFDGTSTTIYGSLISAAGVTFAGASTINGNVLAFNASVTFAENTTINPSLVCYLKGTNILTETGYVAIEHLKVGDKVATKGKIYDNQYINEEDEFNCEPIKWIGNFRAPNLNEQSFPICITAHAFGENTPFENLYLSPGHRILIDGKMVLAESLVNGTTIFQDCNRIEIEYYHLELESHSAIVANGVLSESYLDVDNRVIFENKPLVMPLQLNEAITA